MGIAHALRRNAGGEVVQRLVAKAGDLHVEQRGVDVLAFAGPLAVRQRGEHADGGIQAGEDVGQRHADLDRPGALFASLRPVRLISPPRPWIMKS
ncbi:hypothetical protein SSTU70S_05026 [Stutzerimonas stutzeri]